MTVAQRFTTFLSNIAITTLQEADGASSHKSVRKYLNLNYYSSSSELANSFLTGSWAKNTQVRPPRDVDLFFILPDSVYLRYQQKIGNRQSQLLQEIKNVLQRQFRSTDIRGDGPAVVVAFSSYSVEVVPAFTSGTQQFKICNTTNGGSYITTDPKTDIARMSAVNSSYGGKSRDLIRMLKKWQDWCSVPLKSFVIELLVNEFLPYWEYRDKTIVYYDYMIRDFFKWLVNKGSYSYVTVPGTGNTIWLGSDWLSKASSARDRAIKACSYEADPLQGDAGEEWQKIFGNYVPR